MVKKSWSPVIGLSLFLIFCSVSVSSLAFAQEQDVDIEELKKTAPKIFIDCGMCDIDYIRTEITFVNYVRDRKEAEFRFDGDVIKSDSESHNLNGLIVKSISEHWSVGGFFSILSATYSNIQLRVNPAPAVEYNFFPYSESTKKQLRLLYRLGFNSIRYRKETIYEKTYENLWQRRNKHQYFILKL